MRDIDKGEVISSDFTKGTLVWVHANFLKWLEGIASEGFSDTAERGANSIKQFCTEKEAACGLDPNYAETLKGGIKDSHYGDTFGGLNWDDAFEAWRGLMRPSSWKKLDPNFPAVAEIATKGASFLPQELQIGERGYYLSFSGLLYLPQGCESASWSSVFWEYMAPRYEDVADLRLKHGVMDLLFEMLGTDGWIYDACCGSGLAHLWKPERVDLYGRDISLEMIEKARARGEVASLGNVCEPLPLVLSRRFDGAIMSFGENWLNWDEKALAVRSILSMVKDGGGFAFNIVHPYPKSYNDYPRLFSGLVSETNIRRRNIETSTGEVRRVECIMGVKWTREELREPVFCGYCPQARRDSLLNLSTNFGRNEI